MGKVICVFRLMPKEPAAFDELKAKAERLGPAKMDEEPIAFGLKALKLSFVIDDAGGTFEKLEKKLEGLGAESVENIMTTRSL
jgi:translation elongation factor EF-1beta